MKKAIKIIGIALVFIVAGLWGYKQWQKKSMAYEQPKLETNESLTALITKNQLPGVTLLAKDSMGYDFLSKYLSIGVIMVLDQNNKVVNCNFENIGGECYADIVKQINNHFEIAKKSFPMFDTMSFYNKLIASTQFLQSKDANVLQGPYKYKVLYSWAKYSPVSFRKEQIPFSENALSDKDVLFVNVNLDYVNTWFGNDGTLVPMISYQ